jgi:uncharacterized Tic20 family protein
MKRKAETSISTQDERVMAAIAHATIIFAAVGLLGPLVVWGTQREKSEFLAFQALQAAVYQFVLILGGLLVGVLYMCSFFVIPFLTIASIPADEGVAVCLPMVGMSCSFGILFLIMLGWLAYIGYGLFAAVSVLQGKDFRYAFLGEWLERYVEQV